MTSGGEERSWGFVAEKAIEPAREVRLSYPYDLAGLAEGHNCWLAGALSRRLQVHFFELGSGFPLPNVTFR